METTIGKFTCGHDAANKPSAFGRGAARVKRIAQYLNRPCADCRCAAVSALYADPNFHPLYSLEVKLAKVRREY